VGEPVVVGSGVSVQCFVAGRAWADERRQHEPVDAKAALGVVAPVEADNEVAFVVSGG
jgi:hypothetical protein